MYAEKTKPLIGKDTYTSMFIAAPWAIAMTGEKISGVNPWMIGLRKYEI